MSKILLAIGGGIAAYKTAALCSRLTQAGNEVRVLMTKAATTFVGPPTFAALSGHPVGLGIHDDRYPLGAHIEFAKEIDLMVVAPATADLLAKFALGLADDVVSTTFLQNVAPVIMAPAMSDAMWIKESVQRNIQTLRSDGIHFVGPESGWLACRQEATGRMSEPETILEAVDQFCGEQK